MLFFCFVLVLCGERVGNECCEIRSLAGLKISWVSPQRMKIYPREGLGAGSFRKDGIEGLRSKQSRVGHHLSVLT